jgi:hypothetical protein
MDWTKYFDNEDFGQTLRTTILDSIICSFYIIGQDSLIGPTGKNKFHPLLKTFMLMAFQEWKNLG